MRCEQFEDRLNEVLDRREDPRGDRPLMDHIAVCRPCRGVAASYALLTSGAEQLRAEAEAAPVLEPAVAGRRSWTVAVVGPLLATAAVATLALFRFTTGEESPPSTTFTMPTNPPAAVVTAALPPAPPRSPKPLPAAPVVDELARTTGRASVGLFQGTVRGVDEAFALASALPPPHELLEPMLFPEDGLLRRMEASWAPAAGQTFDALRQVFRPDDSQQL